MAFYKYLATISLFLLVVTGSIKAESADLLFVKIEYQRSTQKISITNIETRTFDKEKISSSYGDYELELLYNQEVISKTNFFISTDGELEIIPSDPNQAPEHRTSLPDIYSTIVELELSRSIEVKNTALQIKKEGQVIYSKALADLPLEVVSMDRNKILFETPQLSFPPFPKEGIDILGFNISTWLLWLVIGVALLIGILLFLIPWLKKRGINNKTPNIPLPPGPSV